MELVTVQSSCSPNWYVNDMTKEIDKHVSGSFKVTFQYTEGTHFYEKPEDGVWLFRFPGATRGYITLNEDNTIKEIIFHDDTCFSEGIGCYDRSVKEAVKCFIGAKIVLE